MERWWHGLVRVRRHGHGLTSRRESRVSVKQRDDAQQNGGSHYSDADRQPNHCGNQLKEPLLCIHINHSIPVYM